MSKNELWSFEGFKKRGLGYEKSQYRDDKFEVFELIDFGGIHLKRRLQGEHIDSPQTKLTLPDDKNLSNLIKEVGKDFEEFPKIFDKALNKSLTTLDEVEELVSEYKKLTTPTPPKQEKKLLEVGDVVYREYGWAANNLSKLKIVRVTAKRAYTDNNKTLYRDIRGNGVLREYGRATYSYTTPRYVISTPTLDQKYLLITTKAKVESLWKEQLKTLTLPQLLSIQSILTNPQKEESVGWIKVEDLDVDNLPGGDFVGFGDGTEPKIGKLEPVLKKGEFSYVGLEFEERGGWYTIKPTHIISYSSLLKLPSNNTPTQPTKTTKEVKWIPIEEIDMEEGVTDSEGEENWRVEYLGVDKEGMMLRGYYSLIRNKKLLENDDHFIYPTHLIPLKNLLHLPKK